MNSDFFYRLFFSETDQSACCSEICSRRSSAGSQPSHSHERSRSTEDLIDLRQSRRSISNILIVSLISGVRWSWWRRGGECFNRSRASLWTVERQKKVKFEFDPNINVVFHPPVVRRANITGKWKTDYNQVVFLWRLSTPTVCHPAIYYHHVKLEFESKTLDRTGYDQLAMHNIKLYEIFGNYRNDFLGNSW